MAQQLVDIGAAPDDGNGDPLRTAMDKLNDNDTELYARLAGLITGSVTNFAGLPAAAGASGAYYLVDEPQGTFLLFTKKEAGIYKSNGSVWNYLGGAFVTNSLDSNHIISDDGDNTKKLKTELSGSTTGTSLTQTTSQTADRSVDWGDISGDMVVSSDQTNGHIMVADGSDMNSVLMSGDATIASDGTITVVGGATEGVVIMHE